MNSHPLIIQGGMGVAVSGWRLARAVAEHGQLGVVSGTALAVTMARRLQLGDPDERLRHALAHFPIPAVVARILHTYFVPGGKPQAAPFKPIPMPTLQPGPALTELTVAANFAEVFLAKQGHDGRVGLNLLEKIQLPTLPSLFGAMLAGVDYVLMGAGIPRAIPGVLDRLAEGQPAELRVDVHGAPPEAAWHSRFDPRAFFGDSRLPDLIRPAFLGIVSSATLALTLARKSSGRVDGFVVEHDSAGGHNAPPRGPLTLSPQGEPVYGPRDVPDLAKIRALGLPFWLAGSYGRAGQLPAARALGAAGIQVGTAFAFCEESGLDPQLKHAAIALCRSGDAVVFTDPLASPTGFPFKVVQVPGTLSDPAEYTRRTRICDLGYLRHLYAKPDGSVGYRCPSEPVEDYLNKGGLLEETQGRKCICNGLPAAVGLGQQRPHADTELALLTAGNSLADLAEFLTDSRAYTAADVIRQLLEPAPDRLPSDRLLAVPTPNSPARTPQPA